MTRNRTASVAGIIGLAGALVQVAYGVAALIWLVVTTVVVRLVRRIG